MFIGILQATFMNTEVTVSESPYNAQNGSKNVLILSHLMILNGKLNHQFGYAIT